jgi:hypothetical protein
MIRRYDGSSRPHHGDQLREEVTRGRRGEGISLIGDNTLTLLLYAYAQSGKFEVRSAPTLPSLF